MGEIIDRRERFLDPQYIVDSFAVQIYVARVEAGKKTGELTLNLPRGWHPADLTAALEQAAAQAKAQDEAAHASS